MSLKSVFGLLLIVATPALSAPFAANLPNGDHGSHPPMGPPLSVVCAAKPVDQQFLCLHPGYAALLVSMTGLSIPFAGDGSGVCAGYYDGFHAGCRPAPVRPPIR